MLGENVSALLSFANSLANCSAPGSESLPACNPTDSSVWRDVALSVTAGVVAVVALTCCLRLRDLRHYAARTCFKEKREAEADNELELSKDSKTAPLLSTP